MPVIQLDPSTGLEFIDDGSGHRRFLAAFPTPDRASVGLPRFSDLRQVVPRPSWKDFTLQPLGASVWDQNGFSSCVGNGSTKAFDIAWRAAGQTPQEFSPAFTYAQINGGRDQGAVVGDALVSLQQNGVALMSEVPESMIYKSRIPQGAFATARRFKIDPAESFNCPSFDEIGSALLTGCPVSFGVEIGQAFEPDSQGVIPDRRGGGGGHCMCAVGLKQINGRWYLHVQNSWATRWGLGGFCYMPESYFQGGDNWSVRAALDDPSDPTNPPVAKE